MKQIMSLTLGTGLILVLVLSCRKSFTDTTIQQSNDTTITYAEPKAPFPKAILCDDGPDYGDSIIYKQPTSGGADYFLSPINNPGAGQYLAWPAGLSIDSANGTIDISKSLTGQRYTIGFIRQGSIDTCLRPLVIGGTSYLDSVYNLSVSSFSAPPVYNANPDVVSPCSGSGCHFASASKINGKDLVLNDKTGIIDLHKTFINGIFGAIPLDGSIAIGTVNYTINDNSNNAPQTLQVRFIYYNSYSSIPVSLLDEVESSRTAVMGNKSGGQTPNQRPPLVIITRYN